MSRLSKRLQVIADLVNKKNICDVGCDHGKLVDYLLSKKIVDYAIVSDISQPSLNKAIELLSNKNYKFDYICCDGLAGYTNRNIDQCVISGMGGDEIINIIKNSPIEIESYILSPQHNNIAVKKFMLQLGYNIDYDIMILDKGKFYNIFRCIKSDKPSEISEFELIIGKDNFTESISSADEFVEYEINKINMIVSNSKTENVELKNYLQLLKQYNKRK